MWPGSVARRIAGVWFPQPDQQPPATRFLDEITAAGYGYLELGPWGDLTNDRRNSARTYYVRRDVIDGARPVPRRE
jgi:hypothetical protein